MAEMRLALSMLCVAMTILLLATLPEDASVYQALGPCGMVILLFVVAAIVVLRRDK